MEQILAEFVATVPAEPSNRFGDAADVFREVALAPELPSFLTIIAYPRYLVPHEETPRDETTAA